MLLQVLIQHTSHPITQSVPYGHCKDKCNIHTTCPPLTEVSLQTTDPPAKQYTLDSSGSLFLAFGLHAAFNHHTPFGPYITYIDCITSSTLGIPDSIYEDEITCLPLRLQNMYLPSKLHALDGSVSFFDYLLLSTTKLFWVFIQRAFHAISQSISHNTYL